MEASPATANSSALAHRDFRRFLGATFLAILAMQIQSVAVSWQIYGIARTPLALGYVGLFQFLPMMACTIPAGHLADRFDRRMILVISQSDSRDCVRRFSDAGVDADHRCLAVLRGAGAVRRGARICGTGCAVFRAAAGAAGSISASGRMEFLDVADSGDCGTGDRRRDLHSGTGGGLRRMPERCLRRSRS